jgi:hypothetical protein
VNSAKRLNRERPRSGLNGPKRLNRERPRPGLNGAAGARILNGRAAA